MQIVSKDILSLLFKTIIFMFLSCVNRSYSWLYNEEYWYFKNVMQNDKCKTKNLSIEGIA